MAFYLSTNGILHPYQFKYLEGDFEKARLERTEIHAPSSKKLPRTLPVEKTEFFAIDIMNKPVFSLHVGVKLDEVREAMKTHDFRHIPIVKHDKLIGMVSDRDLLKIELAGTFSFLKVEEIMSSVLVVAEEDTPLAHVARVLMEEKISALPVIDKKTHLLVGMISRTDILRTVVFNRLVLK